MDQYRQQTNNKNNGATNAIANQKPTLWSKLYKRLLRIFSFVNIRGRQLLWIGSTGKYDFIQGSLSSSGPFFTSQVSSMKANSALAHP